MISGMKAGNEAHIERASAIIRQLRDEEMDWLGWKGMSEPQAIGEYLIELTNMDIPLDSWLMEARRAYEAWKSQYPIRNPSR